MSVSMSRNQAVAIAEKLREGGATLRDISKDLAKNGHKTKNGTPLSVSSVSFMLKKKKRRSPMKRASIMRAPRGNQKLSAVRSILKIKGMDPTEKIALALLVME